MIPSRGYFFLLDRDSDGCWVFFRRNPSLLRAGVEKRKKKEMLTKKEKLSRQKAVEVLASAYGLKNPDVLAFQSMVVQGRACSASWERMINDEWLYWLELIEEIDDLEIIGLVGEVSYRILDDLCEKLMDAVEALNAVQCMYGQFENFLMTGEYSQELGDDQRGIEYVFPDFLKVRGIGDGESTYDWQ